MARTQEEIYNSLLSSLQGNIVLKDLLTSDRDAAVYRQILNIVAGQIAINEQNNDLHNLHVEDRAKSAVVFVVPWYGWATKNIFQIGDTLTFNRDTGVYGYAVENESRKIVDLAAAEEEGSRVVVKALKYDAFNNGTPLTGSELTALQGFWDKYKLPGMQVICVSQQGDEVWLTASIEVNTDIIDTSGLLVSDGTTKPVEDAIINYYTSYQTDVNAFNSTFYIRNLEDAIQAVDGVVNVAISRCDVKPLGGSYSDVLNSALQKYTPYSGWLREDSVNDLSSNLSYIKAT